MERLLERHDIDVLALQETKAREDQLPLMGLQSMGYDLAYSGINQWNGVAILSRVGIEDVEVGFEGMPGWGDPIAAESRADRRHVRRGAGVVALRAERPQDRRPALRLQARLAGPAPRDRARLAR